MSVIHPADIRRRRPDSRWDWSPSVGRGRRRYRPPSQRRHAGASVTSTEPTAAQAGAGWLGRQFHGAFIGTKATPDPGSTAEAVLAFAAAGAGGTKARAAIHWLKKHFESYVSPGGVDDAGALATVILAAQAMGAGAGSIPPRSAAGRRPTTWWPAWWPRSARADPTPACSARRTPPSTAPSARGSRSWRSPTRASVGPTAVAAGVTWLQNQQCADGGWESYRSDLTTRLPRPRPRHLRRPRHELDGRWPWRDWWPPGATLPRQPAAVLRVGAEHRRGFRVHRCRQSVARPRLDRRGHPGAGGAGPAEQRRPSPRPGGATPFTALATFQLGCSAPKAQRGAYTFPGESGPNLLATLQAVPGAAGVAFPLPAQTLPPALPTLKCPAH